MDKLLVYFTQANDFSITIKEKVTTNSLAVIRAGSSEGEIDIDRVSKIISFGNLYKVILD